MTATAYTAAMQHLRELANNGIAASAKPSAFHHGLITQLVREIEELRAQLPTASPTLERNWDRLWPAATGVTAAYETYSEPNNPRPAVGIFKALDRLTEQCAALRQAVNEISPDEVKR